MIMLIFDLPVEFGVSTSFNVADLKPYLGEDEKLPSRTTSVQEVECGHHEYIYTSSNLSYSSTVFGTTFWANYSVPCKRVQLRHDAEE
jgi:hypothetical protein